MAKVLVTGAAGFIGSHLCERLLAMGHSVVGVDNFLTGRIENVEHLLSGDFELIEADISKQISIEMRLDYILHLASPASPVHYSKYPLETLRVNSIGTLNCIDLALKNKARLIVASTSEIYGDPLEHPQKETYYGNANSYGARSSYDESKRFMEAAVYTAQKSFGLNAGIARIFNTYGERMAINDGRVIPEFICNALAGKEITIFGEGSQTRSFCYISDMVDGILALTFSDYQSPINLGNPEEITVNQLAEEIAELTGVNVKINYKNLPENDPLKRKPDISLAQKILGWEPKVGRQQGLKNTINYFRSII